MAKYPGAVGLDAHAADFQPGELGQAPDQAALDLDALEVDVAQRARVGGDGAEQLVLRDGHGHEAQLGEPKRLSSRGLHVLAHIVEIVHVTLRPLEHPVLVALAPYQAVEETVVPRDLEPHDLPDVRGEVRGAADGQEGLPRSIFAIVNGAMAGDFAGGKQQTENATARDGYLPGHVLPSCSGWCWCVSRVSVFGQLRLLRPPEAATSPSAAFEMVPRRVRGTIVPSLCPHWRCVGAW